MGDIQENDEIRSKTASFEISEHQKYSRYKDSSQNCPPDGTGDSQVNAFLF
jgi:hypothetical protein